MNAWVETASVILVAVIGGVFGMFFSRSGRLGWLLGYLVSFFLIAILVMARCESIFGFVEPFSWISAGRVKFVVLALAITMGFTALGSQLYKKGQKIIVCTIMVIFVLVFTVGPFISPALANRHLSSLETQIDSDGICIQNENYTCGPAAAVTALRWLGFEADEGEIAVLSRSGPVIGTLPRTLNAALAKRYSRQGLKCEYRRFDSISDLNAKGITLVVIKEGPLSDHCVAVLDVRQQDVVIADPVMGKQFISHRQFEKIWRFYGIVLERAPQERIKPVKSS